MSRTLGPPICGPPSGNPLVSVPAATFAVAFSRHERAHGIGAARVQHVRGLHPAAPGSTDPEPHLPLERFGAMTVAVYRQRDAGFSSTARDRAVHVEMTRRAVHFEC